MAPFCATVYINPVVQGDSPTNLMDLKNDKKREGHHGPLFWEFNFDSCDDIIVSPAVDRFVFLDRPLLVRHLSCSQLDWVHCLLLAR